MANEACFVCHRSLFHKKGHDGGVRKVFHAVGIFGAQSPFRAMRHARLL